MAITLLKLVTGEEIIGKISTTDTDFVVLDDVRTLAVHQTSPGEYGIALVPWMAGAPDTSVEVSLKQVVGRVNNVPLNLENAYLQQVSGLQLANGGGGGKIQL